MRIRIIAFFVAAAAVISVCCGFVFSDMDNYARTASVKPFSTDVGFDLGTAKSCLSLCSSAAYRQSLEAKLTNLGYTDFEYSASECKKSDNSVGMMICRDADNPRSICIVFRGTQGQEWYSNFNIGDSVEHAGFSTACDCSLTVLRRYLSSRGYRMSDCDFLITGHSRGGAVANLMAARLLSENECYSCSCYTFACPNTTTSVCAKDDVYNSIYNFVNPEDFICYSPLPQWGYTKYGMTVEFPKSGESPEYAERYSRMQKEFSSATGIPHRGFENGSDDVVSFTESAAGLAGSVLEYYEKPLTIGDYNMTLYDFMLKLASLMCGNEAMTNGLFLASSSCCPEITPMADFLTAGLDYEKLSKTQDFSGSYVSFAHTYETYAAWLNCLVPGDADNDGRLTAADARAIARSCIGSKTLDNAGRLMGDIDGNGTIDLTDCSLIQKLTQ